MSQNAISPELVAGVILKVVKSDGPDFRNIVVRMRNRFKKLEAIILIRNFKHS